MTRRGYDHPSLGSDRSLAHLWLIILYLHTSLLAYAGAPSPLERHPGNVFLSSEPVIIFHTGTSSGHWQRFDYDRRSIAEGSLSEGLINLGRLPTGYYELEFHR